MAVCGHNLDAIRGDPVRYSFSTVPERLPFAAPTLIVTGRQDGVVGYQDDWELLPHYPRATYVALDRMEETLATL